VTATTETEQIKRAYRRLLSKHHPDKLVGGGATPAQLRAATERTRELHNAYGVVRQRRDF
jgi:DnaJ like chaperone protein